MPKRLEEALKRAAIARGYPKGSKRYQAYVYGTINKAKGKESKAKKDV